MNLRQEPYAEDPQKENMIRSFVSHMDREPFDDNELFMYFDQQTQIYYDDLVSSGIDKDDEY